MYIFKKHLKTSTLPMTFCFQKVSGCAGPPPLIDAIPGRFPRVHG